MSYSLNIDAEGYLASEGKRLNDDNFGKTILENLVIENRVYFSTYEGKACLIYSFDHPLIVQSVDRSDDVLTLNFPYNYKVNLDFNSLRLDEWDRFCGYNEKQIPYVFSRKAQAQFFDLLDSFTDETVTFNSTEYELPSFYPDASEATNETFWSERYQEWKSSGEKPGWDLKGPHPAIGDILPQIKMNKASIAVLGAGAAHDAAFLASKGHIVTAFDISDEAIEKAKSLYPESTNLKYVKQNLLEALPSDFKNQFDLVFEHTFFCAVDPLSRKKVVDTYRGLLHEEGHLLGIFFTMSPEPGPPFGATEWELHQRLEKYFKPLYWTRWQHSPKGRQAWELVTYLKKN